MAPPPMRTVDAPGEGLADRGLLSGRLASGAADVGADADWTPDPALVASVWGARLEREELDLSPAQSPTLSPFAGAPYFGGRVRIDAPAAPAFDLASTFDPAPAFAPTPLVASRGLLMASSPYAAPSSYAGGGLLSEILGAVTTVSGEARNWYSLTSAQSLARARLNADTSLDLAKLNATVALQLRGAGGLAIGGAGFSLAPYLPWVGLVVAALVLTKLVK